MLPLVWSKDLGLAVALAAIATCVSQTPQTVEGVTPQQLAAGMKIYLRDSAEFPLHMDLVLVATDSSGQLRQRKTGNGNYDFHGYNPRSRQARADYGASNGTMPVAHNAYVGVILPTLALDALSLGASPVLSDDPAAGLVTVKIDQTDCGDFKWSSEDSAPEQLCGPMEFQVKEKELSLVRLTFQGSKLPISTVVKPFGKCELRAYRVEAEYQQVFLPGDPKPFLVPKHVQTNIETDKGTVLMTSHFVPRK